MAASRGLASARAGTPPESDARKALETLSEMLRSAAVQGSLVSVSERLGLSSDNKANELVTAMGERMEAKLEPLAEAIRRAATGTLAEDDGLIIGYGMKLLLAISEARLADARRLDRGQDPDVPWPTSQSIIL